ncbi:MAG: hypothetical protein ACM3VX_09160 [Bacteroidota bacterium]
MSGELAQYNPSQYNVLIPTQSVQQLGPWHRLSVSEVRINPDPQSGEVFKVGSRRSETTGKTEDLFMPTKPAVMSLANAAGIVWNWRDSVPLAVNPTSVIYRAVGAIRLPDGSWQPIMATKEIDLTVIEDELRQQFTAKANHPHGVGYDASKNFRGQWQKVKVKDDDGGERERNCFFLAEDEKQRFIEASVHANLIQWRKNKLARAETGAMLRVIRMALAMKTAYTRDELQKPFIVPRIDFAPDYNDPAVRRALIENGVQGMATLYANATPPAVGAAFAGSHPALTAGPEVEEEAFAAAGAYADEPEAPTAGAQATLIDSAGTPSTSGAAQPATSDAQPAADSEAAAECMDCGKPIKSSKVVDYSVEKFGRPLCYGCQQKAKGGGQA